MGISRVVIKMYEYYYSTMPIFVTIIRTQIINIYQVKMKREI